MTAREFEPGIQTAEGLDLGPAERMEPARGSRHRRRRTVEPAQESRYDAADEAAYWEWEADQ